MTSKIAKNKNSSRSILLQQAPDGHGTITRSRKPELSLAPSSNLLQNMHTDLLFLLAAGPCQPIRSGDCSGLVSAGPGESLNHTDPDFLCDPRFRTGNNDAECDGFIARNDNTYGNLCKFGHSPGPSPNEHTYFKLP